jgi:hypothetical protein
MGRGKVVIAPDGDRWLIRRRWLDRPLPDLRRRFRSGREEGLEDGVLEALPFADWADGWPAIALTVALLLTVFVLLPLLGVALELIVLIFLLCSGVVGRLFLGRPWIVEAIPRDGKRQSVTFPIKGWRQSGKAATDLAQQIAVTGRPEQFEVPESR